MTAPLSPADYHTRDDLQTLGEQIRDKAIRVTVEYESAQVVGAIHTGHAHDPMVDGSGRIAPDPPITDRTISAWAHGAYDGVPAMFTSFATADPRGIQPMIDALWGVAFALKPEILASLIHSQFDDPIPAGAWKPGTDLTTRVTDIIDTRLRYWHGTASDRFAQDFLNPLRGAVSRQCELAVALAVALTAQQQVTLAAHRDVWDIGHKTLAVLDSLHACSPHDATVALAVVTAAISVILAVPTSGLSFAGTQLVNRAASTQANIDVFTIMPFDFGGGNNMFQSTVSAPGPTTRNRTSSGTWNGSPRRSARRTSTYPRRSPSPRSPMPAPASSPASSTPSLERVTAAAPTGRFRPGR